MDSEKKDIYGEEKEKRNPVLETVVGFITIIIIVGIILLFVGPFKIFGGDNGSRTTSTNEERDLICSMEQSTGNETVKHGFNIHFDNNGNITSATESKVLTWLDNNMPSNIIGSDPNTDIEDDALSGYEEFKMSYETMSDAEKNREGYIGEVSFNDMDESVRFSNNNTSDVINNLPYQDYDALRQYLINNGANCF